MGSDIDKMLKTEAYITTKDHKEDFPNKVSCYLINPLKSSIGQNNKIILHKINNTVQSKNIISD